MVGHRDHWSDMKVLLVIGAEGFFGQGPLRGASPSGQPRDPVRHRRRQPSLLEPGEARADDRGGRARITWFILPPCYGRAALRRSACMRGRRQHCLDDTELAAVCARAHPSWSSTPRRRQCDGDDGTETTREDAMFEDADDDPRAVEALGRGSFVAGPVSLGSADRCACQCWMNRAVGRRTGAAGL